MLLEMIIQIWKQFLKALELQFSVEKFHYSVRSSSPFTALCSIEVSVPFYKKYIFLVCCLGLQKISSFHQSSWYFYEILLL